MSGAHTILPPLPARKSHAPTARLRPARRLRAPRRLRTPGRLRASRLLRRGRGGPDLPRSARCGSSSPTRRAAASTSSRGSSPTGSRRNGDSRSWWRTVPGGSTIPATDLVAKSPADGHTILLTTDSTFSINPHLFAKLSYSDRDFVAVTQLILLQQLLLAHPSVPANNLQELVALARAKPGTLNYGSYGSGSQPHLAAETLKSKAGIDIVHIPYKGIPFAVPAAIAGEVQLTFSGIASSQAHGEGRTAEGARDRRPRALAADARGADLRRAGLSGGRDARLVRALRAGRLAARGGRTASSATSPQSSTTPRSATARSSARATSSSRARPTSSRPTSCATARRAGGR